MNNKTTNNFIKIDGPLPYIVNTNDIYAAIRRDCIYSPNATKDESQYAYELCIAGSYFPCDYNEFEKKLKQYFINNKKFINVNDVLFIDKNKISLLMQMNTETSSLSFKDEHFKGKTIYLYKYFADSIEKQLLKNEN